MKPDASLPFLRDGEDSERRIAKLTKINAALIERVERSLDQQASAYSLFQAATSLESQVRIRTEELKSTLARLEQANAQLMAARDAAEQANRVKTRFFTAVSHDLLQPLHAARLSLSALSERADRPPDKRLSEQLDHSLSSIEEMLRTILDLSKLEAGVTKPALKRVSLSPLFASLRVGLEPIAREKGLLFNARPSELSVISDPLMLRRILQNLTANAVRYTERGEILLAARRRGDLVRIEVWDTGPGIADGERDRIFEEFQRGTSTTGGNAKGFGLGLSIMRRMAETLGHPVGIRSKVGRGSCFTVSAPYAGNVSRREEVKPVAPAHLAYGFNGANILVIDNEPAVLTAMRSLLSNWTCNVRTESKLDGTDSLAAPGSLPFRPDLILADYHLDHGECGLDCVRQLRQEWGENVPAIVITADHSSEIVDIVAAAGCELLRKPVRPAELRALMMHMLS